MELFRVTADGLYGQGIYYLWSDLGGISITDGYAKIHSDKYLSGGIQFVLEGVVMKTFAGDEVRQVHGYPVSYCLLNRISFEQQRLIERV
ncbi:hypothetical protein D3880_03985 [Pseudomonas cavernae]|uniref:Uncharacterized protein n=1 Tax=Pseudomonas cavernae TaxID=2320867 RepID=A0A385YYD1_9PSED|nr:hypothetical protein D3880_03985 [Pseudomonas cavernae]